MWSACKEEEDICWDIVDTVCCVIKQFFFLITGYRPAGVYNPDLALPTETLKGFQYRKLAVLRDELSSFPLSGQVRS